MAVCQNLKIAGKWMFIPLKMVLIGIDPYPYQFEPLSGSMVLIRVRSPRPAPGTRKIGLLSGLSTPGVGGFVLWGTARGTIWLCQNSY